MPIRDKIFFGKGALSTCIPRQKLKNVFLSMILCEF